MASRKEQPGPANPPLKVDTNRDFIHRDRGPSHLSRLRLPDLKKKREET
jgi:hypothetical protein